MHPLSLFLLITPTLAFPTLHLRATNTTCDSTQTAVLISGLKLNLAYQADELKSLKTLQYLSTAAPTTLRAANSTSDPLFTMQQCAVATLLQKGIAVREENQVLAEKMKSASGLMRGLASVAQEQNRAKVTLKGLKAGRNDTVVLKEMMRGVEMGMELNEENVKIAGERGCGR